MKQRTLATLIIALLSLSVGQVRGPGQDPADEFVVGVVTFGTILPIARHARGQWTNDWPGSDDDDAPVPELRDVPLEWLAKPVPKIWTVWFSPGGSATVHVKGMQRYGGCESPPALSLSKYPAPPKTSFDDVHLGLAVDTTRRVQSVHRLARATASKDILSAISVAAKRFGVARPVLRWLYRSGTGTDSTYYFETREANIPAARWPSIVRGWLRTDARGRLRVVGPQTLVCANEEAEKLSCLVPLGVFRFRDHDVWVMEHPEGETHSFELWRMGGEMAQELLSADGGGC